MTEEQKTEITALVNDSLDNAECVWGEVGHKVMAKAVANESLMNASRTRVPSQIPGYKSIEDDKPRVDDFIAMVLDIRDSSHHLNMAISDADVSQLNRVFYETAAVLPACSRIIKIHEGGVTEYLGDGLLAFFRAEKDKKDQACYRAHDAAVDCVISMKEIINPILKERYRLPPIQIGIGMAFSKAILTLTGEANFFKPVAFGKCVFYAAKLSKGNNEVVVDEGLKVIWPKTDTGTLKFVPQNVKGVQGYKIYGDGV